MSKPAVEVYREVSVQLNRYKEHWFSRGTVVSVKCDQYTGLGISAGRQEGCPPDKLPVILENGNTWWYPLEKCEPAPSYVTIPRWMFKIAKQIKPESMHE